MLFGYRFYAWHYKDVRRGLEGAGYDVVVASDQLGPITGLVSIAPNKTTELMADLVLEEVQVEDYDALVFITDYGLSTGEYPLAYQIARDAVEQGKVVAAYDFAPLLLGQAGVLKGVKATAHMSSHNVCTSLEGSFQAICTNRSVERDGKIVTADGTTCSWGCFVRAIEEALQE
jgi:putative intracellular protease/amidase